jgi:hypothetical protein
LPLNQRFAGSKPADGDGFLKAINIRGKPFFVEEVTPLSHVVRFYGMLKNPKNMYEKDTSAAKLTDISRQLFPSL